MAIPAIVLSVVGVLVGALVTRFFGIPDDVALVAGRWIAIGSLALSFIIYLIKVIRNRSKD
ncbi:hypothetical protein [Novosphingobium sp.]|uniref:hypothetical protein n=1 Tax=Novosphingobium sp. TaxID=1874826 RepID=UPI00261CB960|nr:hypothetical protein [Novosphingobium sp.]